jgi:hypothetical protein
MPRFIRGEVLKKSPISPLEAAAAIKDLLEKVRVQIVP